MGKSAGRARLYAVLCLAWLWVCAAQSEVKVRTGNTRRPATPRFAQLPSALTCVSPMQAPRPMDAPGVGSTALHDPRNTLIGEDILVCELPWGVGEGKTPDGMHRVYALLGTVLVSDDGSKPVALGEAPPQDAQGEGQAQGDTLLSFSEWKEKHLENERQQKAKSKQRDKARERSSARTSSATDAPTSSPAPESVTASAPEVPTPAHHESPPPSEPPQPPPPPPEADKPPPLILAAENAPEALAKLKHRWNYASLDCAAVLHQANPSAKFASAILSEKKDRYMLSPCRTPKREGQFVVVELCQHIRIDTIVLANLEFFSSMFKLFSVRASTDLHAPEHEWRTLGHFRARNVRGPQVFTLGAVPHSYYRFLRIDFLEHYGSEYYCPVSLLRVYGRNEREDADEEIDEDDGEADEADEDWEPNYSCDIHVATIRGRIQMCPAHAPSIWPCVCVPRPVSHAPAAPSKPALATNVSALADAPPQPTPAMLNVPANATSTPAPSNQTRTTTKPADAKASEKANPGSESIFRTITKRLAALESNTSLSMQYLQLSSQVLRDKLTELEQSQETRITQLLSSLNTTYTQQLHAFMDEHRTALKQREAAAADLATHVQQLAHELVYEKRRGFAQLVLLFVLLLLLIATRSSAALPVRTRTGSYPPVHTPRATMGSPLGRVFSPFRASPPLQDSSEVVAALEHAALEHDMARDPERPPLQRVQETALPARPVTSVKFPHLRGTATPSPRRAWRRVRRARRDGHERRSSQSSYAPSSEWSDGEGSVHM